MPHKTFGGKGNVPKSSNFGWRTHPISGKKTFHKGVDFHAKVGTPIYATGKGKVIYAGYHQNRNGTHGYGNRIEVRYDNGYTATYNHLSDGNVRVGDTVEEGDLLGKTGGAKGQPGSGASTGAHLHMELYPNSDEHLSTMHPDRAPVDPMEHMDSFENGQYTDYFYY